MNEIFISYSHKDKKFVEWLVERLRLEGLNPWVDNDNLKIGEYILDKLSSAILNKTKLFIAVVSENYKNSNWCRHEIKIKLSDEVAKNKIFVLPLRIDDTNPEEIIPAKAWADFRNEEDYNNSLNKLLTSISYHLDGEDKQKKNELLEARLKQLYTDAAYHNISAESAVEAFHTASTMNPDNPWIWRGLGYIYTYHIKDFQQAEIFLLKAMKLDSENPVIYFSLGKFYEEKNDTIEAKKYYSKADELGFTKQKFWNELYGVKY